MVIENLLPPFTQWLLEAVPHWLLVVGVLAVLGLFAGWLIAAVQAGPGWAFLSAGRLLRNTAVDLTHVSPRRVWALALLAFKESLRRRVVVVFAVFILVLLFAGWFLDPASPDPATLYISFVLTTTSYLVLLLILFLGAFSLPQDLRSRTLHTVVTKPVRSSEIVLGRMLGFTMIGTLLLVVMASVSYLFVRYGLSHTHTLTADDLAPMASTAEGTSQTLTGYTSRVHGHRHRVFVDPSGQCRLESTRGHWHSIKVVGSGPGARYEIGPPQGHLLARVPVYGKLKFRNREGIDSEKGINVGDEWTYRGYIQGGTQAAMMWTFDGITPRLFRDGLPVEMNIGVFRTHKGNIEKGVLGSISLRNPRTGLLVETEIFESQEFAIKRIVIPRKIIRFSNAQVVCRRAVTPEGVQFDPPRTEIDSSLAKKTQFDLFDDLVDNGRVEIWLRCLEPGQYFGAAQADLYLRARDGWFWANFLKGYFGIWLQMELVVAFSVMFSTFLSGAVAMIATLGTLIGGFYSEFMQELARGPKYGGGPFESLYRLVTQENMISNLEPGLGTALLKVADRAFEFALGAISAILPPFGQFDCATWVAEGFDVPLNLLLIRTTHMFAFLLPLFIAGYIFLRTREIAR